MIFPLTIAKNHEWKGNCAGWITRTLGGICGHQYTLFIPSEVSSSLHHFMANYLQMSRLVCSMGILFQRGSTFPPLDLKNNFLCIKKKNQILSHIHINNLWSFKKLGLLGNSWQWLWHCKMTPQSYFLKHLHWGGWKRSASLRNPQQVDKVQTSVSVSHDLKTTEQMGSLPLLKQNFKIWMQLWEKINPCDFKGATRI